MRKSDALSKWRAMKPGQPILPHFEPIQYKLEGSSYGACGIRVDGSPEFVDAVLSRLQDLLAGENHVTRLELTYQPVKARPGRPLNKAANNPHVCYIRLHQRGTEATAMSAMFDRGMDAATEKFFAATA
jgi:hypothetical protein